MSAERCRDDLKEKKSKLRKEWLLGMIAKEQRLRQATKERGMSENSRD